MGLLEEWSNWASKCEGPPYGLKEDIDALDTLDKGRSEDKKRTITLENWKLAAKDERLSKGGDTRLHLGLIPIPFMGNLRDATIFVLMLNPGLSLTDYFEHEDASFRSALMANLHQDPPKDAMPFVSMDPQFARNTGFSYWHQGLGLKGIIERIVMRKKIHLAEARKKLADKLAVIQLVPYRSTKFDRDELLKSPKDGGLPSVKLVKDYVRKTVVEEKCKTKGALVIMARGVRVWNECLPQERGENFREETCSKGTKISYGEGTIIRYDGRGQARGAGLGPNTRGGKAILKHLGVCIKSQRS